MNIISNWKTYLKFLSRNKGYTAIDLFGLSVSLLFVLLIGVYTWQEFSTDRFHEKKDRIYIVGTNSVENGYSMAPRLEARYPEIEKTCRIVDVGYGSQLGVKGDNRSVNANLLCADSTFFDFFSFRLLQGDPKQVLVASSNAVVSQSFARKLYGTEDVVGRSLAVDTFRYVISGVMENLHTTSLPKADVILSIKEAPNYNWSLSFGNGLANMAGAVTFVLTHKETDFRQRADDVLAWYKTFFWPYEQGTAKDMRIEKLTDFYFSGWNSYMLHGGDKRFVLILMSVGIVILLFAMLNYINLTVAQAGFRAKEMATRRLLGSSRSELFWRLMSESVLMCTMAMLLAIFFSFYFAPLANDLLRTQLDLSVLASPITIGAIILFIVLLGCISGWLPASVISKVQPIDVVRGTFRTKTKMTYSKVFITFQNFITIVMLTCSLVMILQINHLIKAPLGYNTKSLYVAELRLSNQSNAQAFVNQVSALGGVSRVGKAMQVPFYSNYNNTTVYEDGGVQHNISFQMYHMDRTTFDILGLHMKQDNHLADPKYYLNEAAMHEMNLPINAPSANIGGENISIAGVISDFHEGNVLSKVSPVMLHFMKPDDYVGVALVEIQGNPYETVKEIEQIYSNLTGGLLLQGKFLDDMVEQSFQSQIRLAKIVGVFTFVAVLISLLGLLAMSTYFIQQRSLEVAVRKVFGSDNRQILTQLVKTFLMYVVFAFFLAVPVAYYFMSDWLADYSYRITLNPFIFIGAGAVCLLISFLTVFYQSWHAANANPIDSFRKANQ